MKKQIVILSLLIALLLISCGTCDPVYEGVLKEADYTGVEGFFGSNYWELTFEDGTCFISSNSPKAGWRIGNVYVKDGCDRWRLKEEK